MNNTINMRTEFKTLLLLVFTCFFIGTNYGQKIAGKSNIVTIKNYKPPKLTTSLGSFADSLQTVPTPQAEVIIALPLTITDAKKNSYTVSSYNFLYKRRVVTEDEATGKVSPASSVTSGMFKSVPLPTIWIEQVRENLKPGEELYFFDIIVKDAQGRVMYAPNLKIVTQ
ncbi:MAG: hypothetical protein ABIO04_13815 [Ferruginibacter sp.]